MRLDLLFCILPIQHLCFSVQVQYCSDSCYSSVLENRTTCIELPGDKWGLCREDDLRLIVHTVRIAERTVLCWRSSQSNLGPHRHVLVLYSRTTTHEFVLNVSPAAADGARGSCTTARFCRVNIRKQMQQGQHV
jgi:hypothetical protein